MKSYSSVLWLSRMYSNPFFFFENYFLTLLLGSSYNMYLLSIYYGPNSVLGSEDGSD